MTDFSTNKTVKTRKPHTGEQEERLIALQEVIHRVGLKKTAIYERIKRGDFPKSRSLGGKRVAWVQSEISAWIQNIAQTGDNQPPPG
jgi:prophage regulatory protein